MAADRGPGGADRDLLRRRLSRLPAAGGQGLTGHAADLHRTKAIADALWSSRRGRERLLEAAAALSAASAAIHLVVAPDHFAEWWGYGVFFLVAAVGQAGLAAVLLCRPKDSTERVRARRWLRPTLILGAIANACIAALYVVTRTAGIPLGPGAGEVEALSVAGLVSTSAEVMTAAALLVVAATTREHSPSPLSPTDTKSRRSGQVRKIELVLGVGAITALVATLSALPVVITAREGGMGPGSALLMGEALLVGATALGAGSAALAPRWASPGSLLLLSAAMTLGAFVAAGFESHLGLIAINAAYAIIGFAAGMAMTELFARAAEGSRGRRAIAVAALLLGAAAATQLVIMAAVPGLVWLVLACAFLGALWWLETDPIRGRANATDRGEPVMGHVPRGVWLLAISAGIVATLASSDSTGMLALMLSSPLGSSDLARLDVSRAALFIAGVLLVAIGATALWLRSGPTGAVVATTGALALTALAGAGTLVVLAFVAPADVIPGQRALSGIGAASVLTSAVGIGLGAICIARGISVRILTASGATVLGVVMLIATGVVGGVAPAVRAPIGALAAAGAAGLGIGVASIALRYALTRVPAYLVRGAAAAGVTAAVFGSFAGFLIGIGVGAQLSRGESSMPGAVALALAAVAAAALSMAVRPSTGEHQPSSAEGGMTSHT